MREGRMGDIRPRRNLKDMTYLRMDEQKHDKILETLGTIKKGMYPYG